jgi:hypothetical protein
MQLFVFLLFKVYFTDIISFDLVLHRPSGVNVGKLILLQKKQKKNWTVLILGKLMVPKNSETISGYSETA